MSLATESLVLRLGVAEAKLLPRRGGLLTSLSMPGPDGRAVPVLWMPPDFSETESGWPGGGLPVLFPFAGRVFHNGLPLQYALGDRTYGMPLHGFAYGLPWSVVAAEATAAELELRSSASTTDLYPFTFTLRARYVLTGRGLSVTVTARNDSAEPMPVAMGFHPYFRAPLGRHGTKAGCRLETTAQAKVRVTPLGGAGKVAPYPETPEEQAACLTEKLLASVILAEHAKPEATLVDATAGLAVQVRWSSQLRYLVLWTKEGENFHCLEPWMGLPDAVSNGQGVVWLPPGSSASCAMEVALQPRPGANGSA